MSKIIKTIKNICASAVPFGTRRCVLCERNVWRFLAYRGGSRRLPALMHALDMVGSDTDSFSCPNCGCHDRERHLFMYFQASKFFAHIQRRSVLHFAPERILSKKILEANPALYWQCDLRPRSPAIRSMNLMSIDADAASFDVVIANHVLEHVADDRKALSEIRRVLKPGGLAVLQTPYSTKLHRTWEDAGINDESARLQAYGQEDHVRLYGSDIFERFCSAGFRSKAREHSELLPTVDPKIHGVNIREQFFLFART